MTGIGWWVVLMVRLVANSPVVGTDLSAGMQLVYEGNDGAAQAPWHVDLVATGLSLRDNADCARTVIRRGANAPADDARLCLANDTLYAWSAARSAWTIQRPVGPGMTVTLPRANGDTVRYETGAAAEETVSGIRLRVIQTTVTTVDSLGRARRRLRERYAIGLTTATGGEFAVPDPGAADGWRVEQRFALRDIRR